jgi:hypothetical protein
LAEAANGALTGEFSMSSVNGLRLRIPVPNPTEDVTHLEISVFYQKAAMNYASYKREPGGIYVSVTPVKIADGMVSFILFSGTKRLLETAERLNRKRLAAVGERVEADVKLQIGSTWQLVQHVCTERGITIESGVLA